MRPRILCDDRVLHAENAFGPLGDLTVVPRSEITPARLRETEALVVRSTTQITADLVEGSRLRFVGTATVGVDHVDEAALRTRRIAFASAARSSAASVAEFTWGLLVLAAHRADRDWRRLRLGVVGVGAIGERVARIGEALGLEVRRIDPPRRAREGAHSICEEHTARGDCDALSLHLPLTDGGEHPTRHLVDADWLAGIPAGALLINTGRGATVRGEDLARAPLTAALDVWEGEPDLGAALATGARVLTPHVAGRSREGLAANTRAIRDAIADFFGGKGGVLPTLPPATLDLAPEAGPLALIAAVMEPATLDAELRQNPSDPAIFSRLRDRSARRRDISAHDLQGGSAETRRFLEALRHGVGDLS